MFSDPREHKRLWAADAVLRRAAELVPVELPDRSEHGDLDSEAVQARNLKHLDFLESVGHRIPQRGGFWRDLIRVAEFLHCTDRIPALSAAYRAALQRVGSAAQPPAPDLEVHLDALPTSSGGRQTPMISGYQPQHDFGLLTEVFDARHEYPDGGQLLPGSSGRALLWLSFPDRLLQRLSSDMTFTVLEGSRVVGRGRIVSVLNDRLLRPPSST